jgi:DNA-binding NarL/FixJ family response regulator
MSDELSFEGKTIIYIEDERAVHVATMKLLRRYLPGITISLAESYAAGAVLLGAAERCDLVITDGTLPGGHGRELIARFFGERRCPWIFLTSEADAPDMAQFMGHYDNRLLLYGKPILEPRKFIATLAERLK